MQFNFDNTYQTLAPELFSECKPTPVHAPQLVLFNNTLASELEINLMDNNTDTFAALLSGNIIAKDAAYIAQAYGGHQFGHFNMLGDGRAILLGEHVTTSGSRFDIQLKGSGITPYSRRGDGRATQSAMLREYLISEAMFALNIPTSRSLAVVATGEAVYREQVQQGAILTRVAASHIRVGTFEYVSRFCTPQTLADFTNYVVKRHNPEILNNENIAISLLTKVMDKQIDLIVNWMRVGFIHGVMNTDNMTISGETIDYGPCAFINAYNPETVYSSIDTGGRYVFGNQPTIALWNLTRLAECLLPLIDSNTTLAIKKAEAVLKTFQPIFENRYMTMMAQKIGIKNVQDNDKKIVEKLLNWMFIDNVDYTNTFVRLMYPHFITADIYQNSEFLNWEKVWKERIAVEENWQQTMQQTNPVYIPRNHKVEEALQQVTKTGTIDAFEILLKRLSTPYSAINPDFEMMAPPAFADDACYKTYCGT
ncbi:MAG: protein adenylyltransferase SelO [Paludibacter sp.]